MCYGKFMPTAWLKELDTGKCTCLKQDTLKPAEKIEKCPHCQLKERESDVKVSESTQR